MTPPGKAPELVRAATETLGPGLFHEGEVVDVDGLADDNPSRLLGKPLHSEEMEHQRLGKPTALAVFASDNLSSSAYATEEILFALLLAGTLYFSYAIHIAAAMSMQDELLPALRHLAVVRYDAFGDMGGHLSWSLALLDDSGNGVVLTSIHGRSDARTYAKNVTDWSCEQQLSPEEEEAITHARP